MSIFNEYLEAAQVLTPYTKQLKLLIKKILKDENIDAKISTKKDGIGFKIMVNDKYVASSESPIDEEKLKKAVLNAIK